MEIRRDSSTTWRTSPDTLARPPVQRSQSGITIWFDTMVASANAATITIEVAEEKPPRKEKIANAVWPSASGRVRTKRSGFAPSGSRSSPITAIGTTNRLISSR